MLSEWGLWNNSWVKNLPVRPLAPRRKTPGQLYPTFRPPGQGQKFWIFFIRINFYTTIITIVIYLKIKRILKQDFFKNNILRNTNQVLQDSLLSAAELLHQVTIMLHITDTCPCSPSSPLFT